MSTREPVARARRWVVKIGSALLTADGQGLDSARLAEWTRQIAALREAGHEIVIVSSGAVAEGMSRLGWTARPDALSELQAAASVGQAGLVEAYSRCFAAYGLRTAQVLLTHEDVADRARYLNARRTLSALLGLGVIPIVNENDAIAIDEIRVGDNDTLGALVVNLLDADGLIILTDQAGVYDADPRRDAGAQLISEAEAYDDSLLAMAGAGGSALGTGGMQTKIRAARQAADSGGFTIIAHGTETDILGRAMAGETVGTLLLPLPGRRRAARKNWIAAQRRARGRVHIDAGAADVLRRSGRSLLPIGIVSIEGRFRRGDLVACVDPEGREIAQGLANHDARDLARILGLTSQQIAETMGPDTDPEFIHRDDLVMN